jgi:uncharacterized protein (TIGR02266 family)
MAEKRERRSHFRGKPRLGRRVEVVYRPLADAESQARECRAFTRNIGVGGAFIVTEQPPPPGSRLALNLHIPTSGKRMKVDAEVRWIAGQEQAVRGMGVKFYGLEVDQLLELNEYFSSLISAVETDEA